jgi:hypothetical protein
MMVCLVRLPIRSFADSFAQDPSLFFPSILRGQSMSVKTLDVIYAGSGCRGATYGEETEKDVRRDQLLPVEVQRLWKGLFYCAFVVRLSPLC